MRYSAIIKFFAVILCAAVILTSLASGIGLLALTECGLYGRSFEDFYREEMDYKVQYAANGVAARYASQELGGADYAMVGNILGHQSSINSFFDLSHRGYVLKDETGMAVLTEAFPSQYAVQQTFTAAVDTRYIKVLKTQPVEEPVPVPSEPAGLQIHTLPGGNTEISNVTLEFADGSLEEHRLAENGYGYLEVREEGTLCLTADDLNSPGLNEEKILTYVTLLDGDRRIVYEAYDPSGLMLGHMRLDGRVTMILPGNPDGSMPEINVTLPGTTITNGDFTAYDAIPARGAQVSQINVSYGTLEEGTTASESVGGDNLGSLRRDGTGNPRFEASQTGLLDIPPELVITSVSFLNETGELLYEASCPGGVGSFSQDEKGYLVFQASTPGLTMPEETAPEVTEPVTETTLRAVVLRDTDVYSMPSTGGQTGIWLKAGTEVSVLRQESIGGTNWARIDLGWISMADLVLEQAAEPALAEVSGQVSAPAISGVVVALPDPRETVPEETVAKETMPEETMPEETTEALPAVAAMALPEEDPLAGYDADQIQTYTYYDQERGQSMQVWYVMEPLSGYTLELQLAPGGDRSEMMWMLLGLAYQLRHYLLLILGGSLALLGLCVVYLCCASAHKRGSDVIRAGALNRLPLDGYLILVGCLVAGFGLLGYEGTEYFLQKGLSQIGLGVLAGCAYVVALLLVAIFFAFVAQIKTPGGFWWCNSLVGRCILLAVRLCKKTVVFCTSQGSSLAVRGGKGIWKLCLALWCFGRKNILHLWDIAKRLGRWSLDLAGRLLRWTSGNLARMFSLLPVTWQFLTTGFALVLLLYIMMRTYKVGYILLGFGIFFAAILYAASAFAILLENARRMSKGDLDTQVDDRMLIGGFRDFAHRLNDLAGVAVIAAQKQLKSERMKTELITNVSHDIKTPLTSIINYVDLLRKPHTGEQQEQYLEVLDRQSQRLKKLVDDLMEMSKASSGNLSVDIQRMDAGETVNQVLGEFADKLDRAQLTPVFRQPDDQVYMLADGRLVWRVMSNLLSNAVKYALPGTRIYLDLMEMEGKVVLSMKNISREELNVNAEELMERFVRGDASRNTEGSGLGLNIAQSLMQLQRGQLQILVDGDLFKVTLIFPGA